VILCDVLVVGRAFVVIAEGVVGVVREVGKGVVVVALGAVPEPIITGGPVVNLMIMMG
jgi:hypothetical protein